MHRLDSPAPLWTPSFFIFVLLLIAAARTVRSSDWQVGTGYRCSRVTLPDSGKTGFSLVAASETGISFSNLLPVSVSITNQVLLDGSGVAAGDVDGDGWCDLYFCAIDGRNTLYRNLGNWRFEDVTERAGVGCAGLRSTGAAFADLDGDGDLDLIVNTAGNGTLTFYNNGQGHFTPAPERLNLGKGAKSIALADFDGDGYLDLYIANYRLSTVMDISDARVTFKTVGGKQVVATFNGRSTTELDLVDRFTLGPRGDFQENGEPDVLYSNHRGTNFVPVPFTGGNFLDEEGRPLLKAPLDWGLAAMFRDINGDGLPDLYVCNDFQTPDRFWINQGKGKFRLLPRLAQRHTSVSSMCVDFADINRDGFDDFLVMDMMSRRHSDRMRFMNSSYVLNYPVGYFEDRPQYEFNNLFLNRGDNTFTEIAQLAGLEAAEWAWSSIFLDVDLDGWEDVLVCSGMERDGRDLDVAAGLRKLRAERQPSKAEILQARLMYPKHADGTLAFRNRRDLTFEEVSAAWGFDVKGVCSAMALADLDNDGDLDVAVNGLNGPALIFRNGSVAPRLAVRLKGLPPNTHAIGARIKVYADGLPIQTQEMICGGRYLSCDDTLRVFAAGGGTHPLRIEVTWRSGRRSAIAEALPNHIYELDEASAPPGSAEAPAQPDAGTRESKPWFEDLTAQLNHAHYQERFNDFARQALLPNKMSQLGPGVAWFDVNGDGLEDLIIGSGSGGQLGIYINLAAKGFEKLDEPAFANPLPRDLGGILGWRLFGSRNRVLAGCANYEDGEPGGAGVRQYDLRGKLVEDIIPSGVSSTGPVALGALAGDGKLALFVGGRVVPARYPEPAISRIYQWDGNQWQLDVENSRALEHAGLVSGAIFTDLNADGYPELVLACDWGPVRIFHNDRGRLSEWDVPIDLGANQGKWNRPATIKLLTGCWNGVTAGDFDGDGQLDLAVSNWGRNTKWEAHRSHPISLYYGDFNADGTVQIVETYYDPVQRKTVPARQLNSLARGLPWVTGKFTTHAKYAIASIEEILGDRIASGQTVQASWFESTVFLNRGDHFEVRVLPVEAQMAPAFGICAADFDGDGKDDLFLAQNFFDPEPDTARLDGGRGLLLKGDGKGGFQAVPGSQSGILVYGQQRGAAVCDFDNDGRPDIAVTQNGAATRLFRNVTGLPGLRVMLTGSEDNLQAFGAVLRLHLKDGWGGAREIHGGSGYWSQDSAVSVLGLPSPATEIRVLWPGGKITTNAVPPAAKEIRVQKTDP